MPGKYTSDEEKARILAWRQQNVPIKVICEQGFFFGHFSDIDRFFLGNVRKFLSYFNQHDRKIFKRYQEIANKFRKSFCLNLFKRVVQKSTR